MIDFFIISVPAWNVILKTLEKVDKKRNTKIKFYRSKFDF